MALISSLCLWSSIKIPFSLYSNKKSTPSIPYVDSCKDFKQRNCNKEAEPAREIVNLRVPTSLSKKEESSVSVPHLRALSISHKKRTHRKCSPKSKTKQIGYVIVPSGVSLDKSNDWEEIFSNDYEERSAAAAAAVNRLGEDFYEKYPEFDIEGVCGECDHVPSVKPWMEEVSDISGKHSSLEHKTLKMAEDKKQKKRQKEHILFHYKSTHNNGILKGKEFKVFQEQLYKDFSKNPVELQGLITKMKMPTTDADYYERKLAELHMIELELKI